MDSEAKLACFSQFVAPTARSWTGPEAGGVREDVRSCSIRARLQAGRTAQAKAAWTGGQPLQAEGNKEDGKEGSERARY
ncbi:hypothetical protein [Ottowia massiliensis]|jgi:hypothetical protein|uniref:hypothetical protein n=1 Tax=Ottowia massiliensis TaxID=2045302 RepID=UPI000C84454A|nr:hypothetical protein [Ottowia massiliensis]